MTDEQMNLPQDPISEIKTPNEIYNNISESDYLKLQVNEEFTGELISFNVVNHPQYGNLTSGNFKTPDGEMIKLSTTTGMLKKLREMDVQILDIINIKRVATTWGNPWIITMITKYE